MTDTARAQRKLARLEEELERLREQYREAREEDAHSRELQMLTESGRELAARVEQGRQWLTEQEGEAA